jgi:hypothetical protein
MRRRRLLFPLDAASDPAAPLVLELLDKIQGLAKSDALGTVTLPLSTALELVSASDGDGRCAAGWCGRLTAGWCRLLPVCALATPPCAAPAVDAQPALFQLLQLMPLPCWHLGCRGTWFVLQKRRSTDIVAGELRLTFDRLDQAEYEQVPAPQHARRQEDD